MKSCERFAIVVLFAGTFSFGSAQASQWQLRKGVDFTVGVVATESEIIDLEDKENSTDRTISVSPYIEVSRESRRLSLNGDAGFVYRDTRSEPDAEVNPKAGFRATGVLLDDTLWLDSSGQVSQRRVGSDTIIDDVLTSLDEAVEVYEFSIGPRWEQNLSSKLRAVGAYSYGLIDGSGDEVVGSDAHQIKLALLQALGDGRTQFGLGVDAQKTYFDAGDTATAAAIIAGLSYTFKSNLTGRLLVGRDLLKSSTQDFDERGTAYGAGINWRPLRHLYIDAEYQERAFGRKPAVSIGLKGRVSSVELSWSREASIASGLTTGGSDVFSDSGTSEFIGEVSSDPLESETSDTSPSLESSQVAPLATFASESQNVTEQIAIEYQLRGRVSSFTARLSHLEQQQLAASGGSKANRVQLTFGRSLFKTVQLAFTVSATDAETTNNDGAVTDRLTQEALLTFRLAL